MDIVIQPKGGTFKTFISIQLVEYLRNHGNQFYPVDLDHTPDLTSRAFPADEMASVDPDPLRQYLNQSEFPALMDAAIRGKNLVIDCGANTVTGWETLIGQTRKTLLAELSAANVKITLIVPITVNTKTTDCIPDLKALFPDATMILALIKEYDEEQIPNLPTHPDNLVISLIKPPPALFHAYSTRALSLFRMKTLPDTDPLATEGIPGFANDYLQLLDPQFDKIYEHIS